MPPCPESTGSELNVVKIPAYAWNAIYAHASLELVHAIACRRGYT